MTLWVCDRCGCQFAVGLHMCPQCTGTSVHEHSEEDDDMAKSTVYGGTSDKREGGEGWDGTSSSASTETPSTPTETSSSGDLSTAPTTEPASSPDLTGDSSAPSTDGENPDRPPYDEWTNAELSAELERRELPHTGTKAEMVGRLDAYDDDNAQA